MSEREVRILEREVAFQGYFRVDRYRLRHTLHAGGLGAELQREVFERGHIAAVLPVDPLLERVVLIEQFRPGAWAAGWEPWLLECVAGVLEDGETGAELAHREAHEEAGLRIHQLEPIARFLSSPGASSERCRRPARPARGGRGHPRAFDAGGRGAGAARRGSHRQRQDHHRAAMAGAALRGVAGTLVVKFAAAYGHAGRCCAHTSMDRLRVSPHGRGAARPCR